MTIREKILGVLAISGFVTAGLILKAANEEIKEWADMEKKERFRRLDAECILAKAADEMNPECTRRAWLDHFKEWSGKM